MTDTSKEAVERRSPDWYQDFRSIVYAFMKPDPDGDWVRRSDYVALLSERDALRKAVDSYSYIGRDGKMVLAKDLEDERDDLRAQVDRWKSNSRETWEAMCAMRNAINEHLPLPSIESDLLQGPEDSVFCEVLAAAVCDAMVERRAQMESVKFLLIDKLGSCQPDPINDDLNSLRIKAFMTNSEEDRQKYFDRLSLLFQRGELVSADLVLRALKSTSAEGEG